MLKFLGLFFAISISMAEAQIRTPSHCLAFADSGAWVHFASLKQDEVSITYADHSMYMVDIVGGLRAVADYNGFIGKVDKAPDFVTMNKGHSSH